MMPLLVVASSRKVVLSRPQDLDQQMNLALLSTNAQRRSSSMAFVCMLGTCSGSNSGGGRQQRWRQAAAAAAAAAAASQISVHPRQFTYVQGMRICLNLLQEKCSRACRNPPQRRSWQCCGYCREGFTALIKV
jgi:hypothetical protein